MFSSPYAAIVIQKTVFVNYINYICFYEKEAIRQIPP